MHRFALVLRRIMPALFVATLIAAGFTSPHAALAFSGPPVSGPVCGFNQTFTNNGNGFSLYGTAGTLVTITVTSSSAIDISFFLADSTPLFYMSNALSQTGTFTLPANTIAPDIYFFEVLVPNGTITASISCASGPNTVISGDNRLDNNGDQGAQSVAIYCNRDGSLNLIPLQLLNPGPGSTSIKDTKGNNIIVKTAPLSSIAVNTTAKYAYGISITAWRDGSWTVYRAELTGTGKTFAAQIFPNQCP